MVREDSDDISEEEEVRVNQSECSIVTIDQWQEAGHRGAHLQPRAGHHQSVRIRGSGGCDEQSTKHADLR